MALTINIDGDTQIGRLVFVENLTGPNWQGTVALVNDTQSNRFFAISGVDFVFDHFGPEIMIFEADSEGNVINWIEEACWRSNRNLDEVMWDFSFILETEDGR